MFIVMEGIDGSGKSSVVRSLKDYFESKGRKVITTAEPTRGKIGSLVAETDDLSPEAEALLFTADRACHTDQIRKWVDDGYVVISDRYFGSTLAYQSSAGMDIGWLKAINSKIIIEPDITFLMDMDPEGALERVCRRGEEKSRFERLDYQKKVRSAYLEIAKEFNFVKIDASRSQEDVFSEVLGIISKKG